MEPRSVERLVLASLKTPEDIGYLRVKHNLSKSDFVFFPEVAEFIFSQVEQFGKIPDEALILAQFPEYVSVEPTDNFESTAYEFSCVVIDRLATNSVQAYMGSPSGPGPMEKDAPSALPLLRRSLEAIETAYISVDTTRTKVLDSASSIDRLQAYKDRVKESGQQWLRTGFEPLDKWPLYIAPGMVIGLFADTKVGKSWMSLRIAAEMYRQGYKVAVISPEFPVQQLDIRSDVLLAFLMGYKLSHMNITLGKDTSGLEAEYERYLRDLGDKGEWINMETTVGGKVNMTTITDFVMREKPFFLVIDSVLEMEDEEKNKNSWEQMGAKIRGLHNLALSQKIIILVTNQASKGSSEYFGPANIGDVAYGYDFARGVDVLLSFGKIKDVADRRQVSVPAIRTGQEIGGVFNFWYDPDVGDIGREAPEFIDKSDADSIIGDVRGTSDPNSRGSSGDSN